MTGFFAVLWLLGMPGAAPVILSLPEAVNFANCQSLAALWATKTIGDGVKVAGFCMPANAAPVPSQSGAQPIIVTVSPTFEMDGPSFNGGVGEVPAK